MAIDMATEYTEATAPDANYPGGSFKNVSTPSGTDGTPFEKAWANDFLGLFQRILEEGNVTASGLPDTVLISDYFDAIEKFLQRQTIHVQTGAANAYILTNIKAGKVASLTDGYASTFKVVDANTGASVVRIGASGTDKALEINGVALVGGELIADEWVTVVYDLSNDRFDLVVDQGAMVQTPSYSQDGAYATGTTIMPYDDTIPQITEGDEYLSIAHTPKSASNILEITVDAFFSTNGNRTCVGAIFQDATANALAAGSEITPGGDQPASIKIKHTMVAGTTSATTFRFRLGPDGGALYFNGTSAGRRLGGVSASSIMVKEFKP